MAMRLRNILVLGGTAEARIMAKLCAEAGHHVTLSLAGLTSRPGVPAGVQLRSGGYGGPAGLCAYIRAQQVDLVIDATHPFASTMSWNAYRAGKESAVRVYTLQRPPWRAFPGDRWQRFGSLSKAAAHLAGLPPRNVMLALGGQGALTFRACSQHRFQARVLDSSKTPLALNPAQRWRGLEVLRLSQGQSIAQEMQGLRDFRADLMIVRNAGGSLNAKMIAARRLRLPVWVIDRPVMPPASCFASPTALFDSLAHDMHSP